METFLPADYMIVTQHDTICALATPPGTAGLAVIRISGVRALQICETAFKAKRPLTEAVDHTVHYGWWVVRDVRIDAVTATVFRAPHSYTGEDVVEIGCHGGHQVVQQVLESMLASGGRLAEPGEFTKRAFLNGKLDLTQVEAVGDIIHSQSRVGAQTAARQLAGGFTRRLEDFRRVLLDATALLELELDFSEESAEFVSKSALRKTMADLSALALSLASSARAAEVLRSGFHCAIVGFPNAGKSSLFNALLQRERAIVSPTPGTTRDYLSESLFIQGYSLLLHDTAGIRPTSDSIELQGIHLTSSLIEQSNLVLVVNDRSQGLHNSDALVEDLETRFPTAAVLLVHNKCDLAGALVNDRGEESSVDSADDLSVDSADDLKASFAEVKATEAIECSAAKGIGLDLLRGELLRRVRSSTEGVQDVLVNSRQATLLNQVAVYLGSAIEALDNDVSSDCVAIDIRSALRLLGEITGETWSVDVLEAVFSRFCIGK